MLYFLDRKTKNGYNKIEVECILEVETMLQIKNYIKVSSIDEAYELNQKKSNVIIGGMHWLKMSTASVGTAIDLSGLGLDQIVETDDAFEIGCMVSLRQIETHEGLNTYSSGAVKDAVKDIVGVQFRNTATVGGSIFGRYGFSDVLTVFMAMDTYVVCHKAGEVPICEYAKQKADRDILVKLVVKKKPIQVKYLAQRHAKTDFPMLTCAVSNMEGKWTAVLGARPMKAMEVAIPEDVMKGTAKEVGEYVAGQVTFGSNMRGSAEYRKDVAAVLVKRGLLAVGKEQ